MKAEELRIGNWVLSLEDTPIHVNPSHITNLYANFESIKPISITEEWLRQFGFKHDYEVTKDERLAEDSFTIQISNDTTLRIERDGSYCLEDRVSGNIDDFVCGGINIEYIHQLQNLYYALTGEEL